MSIVDAMQNKKFDVFFRNRFFLNAGCALKTLCTVFSVGSLGSAWAYPVFVRTNEAASLEGQFRDHLIAFSTPDNGKTWTRIPSQFNEVEDDAFLILREPNQIFPVREKVNHPPQKDPFSGRVSRFHRIVLNDQDFQNCDAKCLSLASSGAKKICDASGGVFDLFNVTTAFTQKSAFLTFCVAPQKKQPAAHLVFSADSEVLDSKLYSVKLSKGSPFLLDWLKLAGSGSQIIENSELRAKLKTKAFITINVDRSDLRGTLASVSQLPVATSLEIATTEKIMGFSTVSQVCCDISFFEDSFYFPIFVGIPKTIGRLRDGSDVSFAFNTKAKLVKPSGSRGAAVVVLEQNGKYVAVGIRPTVAASKKSDGVILDKEALEERKLSDKNAGISFDLSGSEGEQKFEAWFYAGTNLPLLQEYAAQGVRYQLRRL